MDGALLPDVGADWCLGGALSPDLERILSGALSPDFERILPWVERFPLIWSGSELGWSAFLDFGAGSGLSGAPSFKLERVLA
ncbi:hypothetical protein J11TS1_27570 [Oceanobacillus sp. J11TS1]|nr:hypothetical protein J11TS1_27570 [Oceanobacillus sp. J11TS1]